MIVAIGCPIEDRAWIVDRYLQSLEELTVPPGWEKVYVFVLGDSVRDRTPDAIIQFLKKNDGALAYLKRDTKLTYIDRKKARYDFEYLARARNVLAALAFRGMEADKLFSIDSDILVEPSALCKLLDSDFPVSAAPVRNSTNPDVMNFMMFKEQNEDKDLRFTRKGLKLPSATQPFVVDLTGACVLIDKEAKDIEYSDYCGGEDTGFAVNCWYEDLESVVIPTIYTEHYMDRENPDTPLVCVHFEKQEVVASEQRAESNSVSA